VSFPLISHKGNRDSVDKRKRSYYKHIFNSKKRSPLLLRPPQSLCLLLLLVLHIYNIYTYMYICVYIIYLCLLLLLVSHVYNIYTHMYIYVYIISIYIYLGTHIFAAWFARTSRASKKSSSLLYSIHTYVLKIYM